MPAVPGQFIPSASLGRSPAEAGAFLKLKSAHRRSTLLFFAALVGTAVLTGIFAYPAMFDHLYTYDDEGYLLLSLHEFLRHGHLYDDVYTQYGPFYYVAASAVFLILRMPVDHDHGRLVTLTVWCATSALFGLATFRMTRRPSLAWMVQLITALLLTTLINEPMHPGGLLNLLLGMTICLLATFPGPRVGMIVAGLAAVTAAELLVKINVGAFALIGLLFAALWTFRLPRSLVLARLAAAALFIATPSLLILPAMREPWATTYAIDVTLSAIAVVIASFPSAGSSRELPHVRLLAIASASAIVVALITTATVFVTGTTAPGLIQGIVFGPLHQADAFSLPLQVTPGEFWLGLFGLASAVVSTGYRLWLHDRWVVDGRLASLFKLTAGATILMSCLQMFFGVTTDPARIAGVALVWVIVAPPNTSQAPATGIFARTAIAAVAVLETLQAYPVAGSQVSWSALMLVPVGALALSDGFGEWLSTTASPTMSRPPRLPAAAILAFCGLLLLGNARPFVATHDRIHAQGVSLGLPGAKMVRVPPAQAAAYDQVTALIGHRCSTFETLPGMNSFQLFSGQEPPSGYNTTTWMFLLDSRQQAEVIASLQAAPHPCIVEDTCVLDLWLSHTQLSPDKAPLYRYIKADYAPTGYVADFTLLEPATGVSSTATAPPPSSTSCAFAP